MAETLEKTKHVGLTWEEVCAFPQLNDLPFKIETNEWGQIVMSPTRLKHGAFQARIARYLADLLGSGEVITEAAIKTSKGAKVADVAWFSAERWEQVKDEFDASIAPEICVEIISPSNADAEIEQKKRLYFETGVREVWTCNTEGVVQFFQPEKATKTSAMVPDFPSKITL